jgi:hypothetical protein
MLKLPIMRRIIFCLILISSYLFLTSSPIQAAASVYKQKSDAILKGNNQERWLKESLDSNAVIGLEVLTGKVPDAVLNGTATNYVPGGVLNFTSQMIASLYTPAASGVEYIASLKDSFLGKPAYAQTPNGAGFTGLQPILPIWRGFRNIVYLLSSLVFIIIGVMVMLRVKISPQAVVTVQNSIPQLVTTLILVTFSYAIAGLLIDLMTFVQGVVIALLFEVSGKGLSSSLFTGIKNYSFDNLTNAGIGDYADLTFRAIPTSVFLGWGTILGAIIGAMFFTQTGGFSTLAIGIIPVVVLLVILIMVVIWMFKFYFGCLKAYITILFKIIVAPLELAMGAFPNSKMGFSSWIWDLIANLAIFPVSMIFMIVGNMLVDFTKTGMWAPSVISNFSIPAGLTVLGTLGLNNIISIGIGISVVALMSKLPDMIPEFIFAIKPSPWGKAIGEGLSTPKWMGAAGTAGLQVGSQFQKSRYAAKVTANTADTGDHLLNAGFDTLGVLGKVKRS